MESKKLYENITPGTLEDKLTIVDEFKSKMIDYIESNLIFQEEKQLEEEIKQIGYTFYEYKNYSENLSKIIQFSKIEKIQNLKEYLCFFKAVEEIPDFLEGVDIIEDTKDKLLIKDINKILDLEVKIQDIDEYMELISIIYSCKKHLKEDYDKITTFVMSKYTENSQENKMETKSIENKEAPKNIATSIGKIIPSIGIIKEEKEEKEVIKETESKKTSESSSILDIFKELVDEELNEKEKNKEIIDNLYEKYAFKKGILIEGEITKIDESYLYLKLLNSDEELLNIKMRKIPLHNYRIGAKEKGYISQISKIEDSVEILIVKSLQSIAANEQIVTKKTATKSKTKTSNKQEKEGELSEKYFKTLFNKIKSELGITMCNIKKCVYDSNYGALIIIDNKKNSSEEIKFVESLMNKRCGKDIVKIIEFKYDAIEFLSNIFEIDDCDVIKGTGKYIVVNYDTNNMSWYKFVSDQINSMVNYKIEF